MNDNDDDPRGGMRILAYFVIMWGLMVLLVVARVIAGVFF